MTSDKPKNPNDMCTEENLKQVLAILGYSNDIIRKVVKCIYYKQTEEASDVYDKGKHLRWILTDLSIPANILGYKYLQEAVLAVCEDESLIHGVTTHLYPLIASRNNTTPSRVERAIRHAIIVSWSKSSKKTLDWYFGPSQSDKMLTNTAAIAKLAEYINNEDLA